MFQLEQAEELKCRKCTYMKKKIEKSEKEKQKHDPSKNGSSSVVGRYPPSSKLAMGRGMEDANRLWTIFIKIANWSDYSHFAKRKSWLYIVSK